jgi:hypothetical protein
MSDKRPKRPAADQRPVAAMFPGGDDTPLLSGTPISIPGLTRLAAAAVDPGAPEGDQSVLFVVEADPFDPAAILEGLSSGHWAALPQGRVVAGYHHAITTGGSAAGRIYPVALVVSEADAAVMAQAKQLLRLVVQAFGVSPKLIADPSWEGFRQDARSVLEACRSTRFVQSAPAAPTLPE